MAWQHTLREKVTVEGVCLHDGKMRRLQLLHAPADHGIVFVRCDLPHLPELMAHVSAVRATTLATTLGAGTGADYAEVRTVEHLLAALHGLGVDNARILVDGPELPILDGSAAPWVEAMLRAGLEPQPQPRRLLMVRREVRVEDGRSWAKVTPASRLTIRCSVDFDHPLVDAGPFVWDGKLGNFARDLAPARTFGFLRDVEALQAKGLALGGSLANAVVIDDYAVRNPEGLRFPDEFVRHKTLDALGDIYLLGLPLVGRLQLHRSGHALNSKLVRAVLADARNYEVVRAAVPANAVQPAASACGLDMLHPAKSLA